jgi:hypothetical protein
MAEDAVTENAKRQLEVDRERSEKSRADFAARMKGKPTPTQHENDMAMLGAPVFEKEDDGSGPDPNIAKTAEAEKPGTYQTRTAQAGRPAAPPARPASS